MATKKMAKEPRKSKKDTLPEVTDALPTVQEICAPAVLPMVLPIAQLMLPPAATAPPNYEKLLDEHVVFSTRLKAIQATSLRIENKLSSIDRDRDKTEGTILGISSAVSMMDGKIQELQAKHNSGDTNYELVVKEMVAVRNDIAKLVQINGQKLTKLEGKKDGIRESADECEAMYNAEYAKFKRQIDLLNESKKE